MPAMPYNTRRKSLSLPALGIQLPNASRAHRASISKPSGDDTESQHSAKRVKRSHSSESAMSPTSPMSATSTPPSTVSQSSTKTVTFADRPKSSGSRSRNNNSSNTYEHTPPPSPGGPSSHERRIDIEGINDDIVAGVITQLEKTGNRPHLIKELATVLSTTNDSVAGSANPAALLSSRLATYMKRSWTALAPCPVAKELIPVHPRKVFYYLTTCPRQELPDTSTDILPPSVVSKHLAGPKRIISPSLSNASQSDDDDSSAAADERRRAALSPSPEIDLSLDLEGDGTFSSGNGADDNVELDFPTPGGSLHGGRGSIAREGSGRGEDRRRDLGLNRRAESPRLEREERDFEDTAREIGRRAMSIDGGEGGSGSSTSGLDAAADSSSSSSAIVAAGAGNVSVKKEDHEGHGQGVVGDDEEAMRGLYSADPVVSTLFDSRADPHAPLERGTADDNDIAMVLSSPLFRPVGVEADATARLGAVGQTFAKDGVEIKSEAMDVDDVDVHLHGEEHGARGEETGMGSSSSILGERRFGLDIGRPENTCLEELEDLFDDF